MAGRKLKSLIAGCALALFAPLLTGASGVSETFEARVLASHNA